MTVCKRCVMDDCSDTEISFDVNGYCNYCSNAINSMDRRYFPDAEGKKKLDSILKEIKIKGKGKKYDCIMGISGGLDSSYLLYLGNQWGLRILAVHVDDGYDTDISKRNIEKLIGATNTVLKVIKPDAVQYNALIKAYMKAGVPNLAIPQDNILFAYLYDLARKNRIHYFLSGGNFASESILQQGNTHSAYDLVNLRDIHRKYGDMPINKLKLISIYRKLIDRKIVGIKTVRPLNYLDYNRERALNELKDFCGFEYYGAKHLENKLTAFVQLIWFVEKFNVDKRKSHFSSLIVSGQMTREEAIRRLKEPLYKKEMMDEYIEVIKKNVGLSDEEFTKILRAPSHAHSDYKTDKLFYILKSIKQRGGGIG